MADSQIVVSALAATATLRGVKLSWSLVDPHANGLQNLALDQVEVWASTTNNRNAASQVASGVLEALHAGAIEEQTYYYWIRPRSRYQDASGIRYYGDWYPLSATAGASATAIGMAGLSFGLANGKLTATVAGNALTVAVKTAGDSDASASDRIFVAFRNSTIATGNYQIRTIEATLSLTISSGSTLSTSDANPFRLWIVLFDDGGTLRLGAQNCFTGSNLYPLSEDGVASSTAEGGAGAADSAGVIYTGVAVSAKPYRILGYLEWQSGLTTAGTWSAGPDLIQMFSPGVRTPGQVVQDIDEVRSAASSGTTTIPFDGSIPQISEGINWRSPNFTPRSKMNKLSIDAMIHCTHSTSGTEMTAALFQNLQSSPTANADAIAVGWGWCPTADAPGQVHLSYRGLMQLVDPLVFQIRIGAGAAGTTYINRTSGDSLGMQSRLYSRYRIAEIMA